MRLSSQFAHYDELGVSVSSVEYSRKLVETASRHDRSKERFLSKDSFIPHPSIKTYQK